MSKHTPTPWTLCERGDYSDFDGDSRVIMEGEDLRRLAVVHVSDKETNANAEFIVRAVNAHEELVSALEAASWFVDHVMGKQKRVDWGNTFDIDWAKLNESLLKISSTLAKVRK